MTDSHSEIRRWVRGHEAAAREIADARRGCFPEPEESLSLSLELAAIVGETEELEPSGEPTEEDLRVYETWTRLRTAAGVRP